MYYACSCCNKPCDIIYTERKVWKINPQTKVKKDERQKIKRKEIKKEIEEFGCA